MLRSRTGRAATLLAALALAALSATAASVGSSSAAARGIVMHPTVADYVQLTASETPPTEAQ
jgi:hypothetical protein